MDDSLQRFVHDAIAKGISRQEIEKTLLAAKWPRHEVRGALDRFAELDFPLPVPRPKPYLPAREAFIYLILFTVLYLSACSLGLLLFQFINRGFPDPAQSAQVRDFMLDTVRWSVATLLIAYPGYLLLAHRTYTAARCDPEKRKSKVRKWLTYLTLFLAAGVLLGDLITLVYNLLEGELTTPFLLKVLTVAGIAGSLFGYYLWDLKQDDLEAERTPARRPGLRLFVAGVTAAVVICLISGFYLAGSPDRARQLALDSQRQAHLAAIAVGIDMFWAQQERLPATLQELARTRGIWLQSILDPETRQPYEYLITGEASYELCAVFESASTSDSPQAAYPDRHGQAGNFWEHGIGSQCFAVEVKRDKQ